MSEYGTFLDEYNRVRDEHPGMPLLMFEGKPATRQELDIPDTKDVCDCVNWKTCTLIEARRDLTEPLVNGEPWNISGYELCIKNLESLVEGNNSLMNTLKKENFNLLFRQAAQDKKYIELLKYLLDNADILAFDIHSKGEKSGNALDVTIKNQNQQAVNLLKEVLTPSKSL